MLNKQLLSDFIRDLSWSGLHNEETGTEKIQLMLKEWCQKHPFEVVSQLCKGMVVQILSFPDTNHTSVSKLLQSYGQVFTGTDVGILGRDLFSYSLLKGDKGVREIVIKTLLEWEDQDNTGIWLGILEGHYPKETDQDLRTYIRNSIPTVEMGGQKILVYGNAETIQKILELFPGGPTSLEDMTPTSNSVYLEEDQGRMYVWCPDEKNPWEFSIAELPGVEGIFMLEGSF
jgi:hypothetical protein